MPVLLTTQVFVVVKPSYTVGVHVPRDYRAFSRVFFSSKYHEELLFFSSGEFLFNWLVKIEDSFAFYVSLLFCFLPTLSVNDLSQHMGMSVQKLLVGSTSYKSFLLLYYEEKGATKAQRSYFIVVSEISCPLQEHIICFNFCKYLIVC